MGRLEGKTIVLSAAAQGIGRATALAFKKEGARVIGLDINAEKLQELQQEGIETRVLNVTDKAAIEDFASTLDTVDCLFNCAGIVHQGSLLTTDEETYDLSMNTNVKSMYLMTRAMLPKMLAKGKGSIINMGSVVSSIIGVNNRFVYGVSKAAVIGLTKSITADYIKQGIRCNCICPGVIETPSLHARWKELADAGTHGNFEQVRQSFLDRSPLGRLGKPEHVAALCVYLASDDSEFVNGDQIKIDDGWSN